MSDKRLPNVEVAYRLLCATGNQFATCPLAPTQLKGVTYTHPTKGRLRAAADRRVLKAVGLLYTGDSTLARALQENGLQPQTFRAARQFLAQRFDSHGTIWGVSGYATPGHNCQIWGQALSHLYAYLCEHEARRPLLVTDSGASAGTLGLNGVLAKRYRIPSLGFTPLQGMASMAPRDHMIIWGDLYTQREELVALAPDILVCAGGGEGTYRECLSALRYGASILLLALTPEANKLLALPKIKFGLQTGRVVCCAQVDGIPQSIDRLLSANPSAKHISRTVRQQALCSYLIDC